MTRRAVKKSIQSWLAMVAFVTVTFVTVTTTTIGVIGYSKVHMGQAAVLQSDAISAPVSAASLPAALSSLQGR